MLRRSWRPGPGSRRVRRPSISSRAAARRTGCPVVQQRAARPVGRWRRRRRSERREIVGRTLDVLEQAGASLFSIDDVAVASSTTAPAARRFEFVRNAQLRPILEIAFADSGRALAEGDFTLSLMTSCGILEAIITDALEHCGSRIADCGPDPSVQSAVRNPQSAMTFEARIAAAEHAGLIRGGCARLPAAARAYRDAAGADGSPGVAMAASERDAKLARQVLHVVMRDLDPGR